MTIHNWPASPEYFNTDQECVLAKPFAILMLIVWGLLPWKYSWPLYAWIGGGLIFTAFKLWYTARSFGLNWKEELWIGLKTPCDGIFGTLVFWPFSLIYFAITRKIDPFSSRYQMRIYNELYTELRRKGVPKDGIADMAKRLNIMERHRARKFRKCLDEAPQQIEVGAKTAYACGIISTTVVGSAIPVKAQTPGTNITASAYGWITAVGQDTKYSDSVILRHVRLRPTISLSKSVQVFGEFDFAELNPEGQNWAKQMWIGYSPTPNWTLRAGRLALTPIMVTPPPFKLETVNYPRLPYRLFAYGAQTEYKLGKWKLSGDVSGQSGQPFSAEDQFGEIEGTFRIDSPSSSKFRFSGQTQFGHDLTVAGMDWSYQPVRWLKTKGAGYVASSRHRRVSGGYAFIGLEPVPALDVYGQIDLQTFNSRRSEIISSGMTLKTPGRRRSLTVGHEWRPHGGRLENQFFLKGQFMF